MSNFSINILFSQIGRLSATTVQRLIEEHLDDLKTLSIVDANQILNFIERKFETVSNWNSSDGIVDIMTFKLIATRIPQLSRYTFEEIDNINQLNPTIQVEVAHALEEEEILNLLNNFRNKLDTLPIQNFILALSIENQRRMIIQLKDKITQCDPKIFLSFLGALPSSNQIFCIKSLKSYMENLNAEDLSMIMTVIYEENIKDFFHEFKESINNLEKKDFIQFMSALPGDTIIVFTKEFKDKIKNIPADIIMYQLGMNVEESQQIYSFWKTNPTKLAELSNTYFNLIISRLNQEQRLSSLTDFKDKYNQMNSQELLDFFEYDEDRIKAKLLLEYPHKMQEIDSRKFIDYINENINNKELRNQIFLCYKPTLCTLPDEDFIYFIHNYSERIRKYSRNTTETTKEELTKFIVGNFIERLKTITSEHIPLLFSESDTCLQQEYIDSLRDNIRQLIHEKTWIKDLLRSCWGNSKQTILSTFMEEWKTLSAKDWYTLLDTISANDYSIIERLLLECDINNYDFITGNITNANAKKMFSYFEKNLQNKLTKKYTELAKNGQIQELLTEYKKLFTVLTQEDINNVLTNYTATSLLILLKVLLDYNVINDQDEYYQKMKDLYMSELLQQLEKEKSENINIIKDSIFYRLVKGSINPSTLLSIKTLKGLIFLSKNSLEVQGNQNINSYTPSEIESLVENLTETQVIRLNNKLFKQLCQTLLDKHQSEHPSKTSIRNLAIKLYLAVGFQHAKKLIELNVPFTRYEYIFNEIETKKIRLNENGEPIINKKLMDFLFGSNMRDENTNINRLLQDKIPDFEKKFAQIYNGWETICQELNGIVTVTRILKWFESHKIILNPDEYRLEPILNEIGDDPQILERARNLYNDMKNRKYSTIPKVQGNYNDEYSYEMLDLDNPYGLIVGYITRCCFLINGESRSSLFHSAQSKDGRIFVVRKNGELIAQSWVWRNGNLVCFDNVETKGKYNWDTLLEIYQEAAKKIQMISKKEESTKEQIKLVTFGGSYSKISKPNELVPKKEIKTPRVEQNIYTDARYEQYILSKDTEQELYYGDVSAQYQDTRKPPSKFSNPSNLEQEEKTFITKKIRSIDFSKTGNSSTINLEEYKYALIADDWYILLHNNGEVQCTLLDHDERAKEEMLVELDTLLNDTSMDKDATEVKKKVLTFLKEEDK